MSTDLQSDTQSLRMCVLRGTQLLDEIIPGWESRINVHILDMGSLWNCRDILGQLFQRDALNIIFAGRGYAFGEEMARAVSKHGFNAEPGKSDELTCEWLHIIMLKEMQKLC